MRWYGCNKYEALGVAVISGFSFLAPLLEGDPQFNVPNAILVRSQPEIYTMYPGVISGLATLAAGTDGPANC